MFNFQGSISLPLSRQLTEYITSSPLCQHFFSSFFKVFFRLSKFRFCDIPFSQTLAPLPRRAFVYRILSLTLSIVNYFFPLFLTFLSLFVHLSGRVCAFVIKQIPYILCLLFIYSFFTIYRNHIKTFSLFINLNDTLIIIIAISKVVIIDITEYVISTFSCKALI